MDFSKAEVIWYPKTGTLVIIRDGRVPDSYLAETYSDAYKFCAGYSRLNQCAVSLRSLNRFIENSFDAEGIRTSGNRY